MLPVAIYTMIHGYAHYVSAQENLLREPQGSEVLTLALLLSIGPISLTVAANQRGINPPLATGVGLASWVCTLVVFFRYIRKAVCALLYINITIMLCALLPRLLVGYTHREHVAQRTRVRWFYSRIVTISAVSLVVVAEPWLCDSFFHKLGGHLVFDVVLFAMLLLDAVNEGRG
eukprot:TRINITY_DN740_c0_g1_i1.p1 TRINITY_DN740_c0_g1~~TRINITY_DN740_c0_g1_i1.p1  ORF type:complete len:174 (+),score=10.53 TRINITY_DN740_c0_g1_i1:477-998(+)